MKTGICTTLLALSLVAPAWAGNSSSGGGMAVVCRDSGGAIQSAKLLDVFEAEQDPTRKVMQASNSLQEDFARLSRHTYQLQGYDLFPVEEIVKNLRSFMSAIKWVELPEKLPSLNDQGETVAIPAGCELEQLAVFYDEGNKISVQAEIWSRLDSLNQAALIKHEQFYRYERNFREHTSESTRSYVRQMVSVSGNVPVQEGVENAKLRCVATSTSPFFHDDLVTEFYVHKRPNAYGGEDVEFQFTSIARRSLLVKTTISIPNLIFMPVLYSAPVTIPDSNYRADLVATFPVMSAHRNDWKIRLKYIAHQPIQLTLLQDGQVSADAVIKDCQLVN